MYDIKNSKNKKLNLLSNDIKPIKRKLVISLNSTLYSDRKNRKNITMKLQENSTKNQKSITAKYSNTLNNSSKTNKFVK